MVFAVQFATFRIVPNFEQGFPADAMAVITYRLITNHSANKPVAGFSAGQTAEIECSLTALPLAPLWFRTRKGLLPTSYSSLSTRVARTADMTTPCASDGETSVTGTYRAELSAFHATNAWFDNLIVRRAM